MLCSVTHYYDVHRYAGFRSFAYFGGFAKGISLCSAKQETQGDKKDSTAALSESKKTALFVSSSDLRSSLFKDRSNFWEKGNRTFSVQRQCIHSLTSQTLVLAVFESMHDSSAVQAPLFGYPEPVLQCVVQFRNKLVLGVFLCEAPPNLRRKSNALHVVRSHVRGRFLRPAVELAVRTTVQRASQHSLLWTL